MAKPSKIESLKLQEVVADGVANGLNPRQIAEECNAALKRRRVKDSISNMAIIRYLETVDTQRAEPANPKKVAVVSGGGSSRVARIVERDIDLIEMQYQTTAVLLAKFEMIVDMPTMLERRLDTLTDLLKGDGEKEDWHRWKLGLVEDIRRNVQNAAILNRELRENAKFMADLREKAFEFNLIQEYLFLFMEEFKRVNPEAYEQAEQMVAGNPRLQRIVEQQKQLRGYEER